MAKLFLLLGDGGPRRKGQPFDDHAVIDGTCPHCEASPFKVGGHGRRPSQDDRAWEADASCLACNVYVGVLRLETNTLFGVREDERVLRGRVRVY